MSYKSDVLRILIINLRQNTRKSRFCYKNAIIIFVSVGAQHLSETVDQNTASMFDYRRAYHAYLVHSYFCCTCTLKFKTERLKWDRKL